MVETVIIITILLAVFLSLRKMLDGKISARLQYSLWLLIALRLLLVWIPLPGSSVSVMNLLPVVQDSFQSLHHNVFGEKMENAGSGTEQESSSQAESPISQKDALEKNAEISQDMQVETDVRSAQGQTEESSSSKKEDGSATLVLSTVLYRIYGTGAVFVLLWILAKNIWFWSRLRRRRVLYEGQLPVASLPGRLYLVDHLHSPFLFGRHIYVSPEMISDQRKLQHILVHESCHWKQGDSLWSVLRCLCLSAYWFHPLVWYGVHLSIVDAELACDERVIRILGEESRCGYGETLLGSIRKQGSFLECTYVSTQMSGSKQETKKRLERIVEQGKQNKGRILFLIVSMLVLCLLTLPGKNWQDNAAAEREWQRVEQEGFPCIVVDEQGDIVGTTRGELLRTVILDYTASKDNQDLDFQNYQIQADAFSACSNLTSLILPNQNASKYISVIDYIDPNAFRGCSKDLVVYCDKESYVWTRLQELGIAVEEIPNHYKNLLGEDIDALNGMQEKTDKEETVSGLSEQRIQQNYGEPFFIMTESGQVLHSICLSLNWYVMAGRQLYFPTDAHTLAGTFPQYLMEEQSITIPKNIVVVGEASFMCCQLSGVTFEEGSRLQTIGNNAFMEGRFTEVSLPEGLQEIGQWAFGQCKNLEEITIPESVHTIDSHCFAMCDSLKRVVILNPDISLGDAVFDDEIINPELSDDEIDMEDLDSNFIPNNRLTIVCHPGSNAEKYAKERELQVEYLE